MPELQNSVRYIKGVGEKKAELYHKLGIETVRDLLFHLPRDYIDLTEPKGLSGMQPGEICAVKAEILFKSKEQRIRKGLSVFKVSAHADGVALELTFFNNRFAVEALKAGQTYLFYGKLAGNLLRREMRAPQVLPPEMAGRLMAVYPSTAGLTSRTIGKDLGRAFDEIGRIPETLPASVLARHSLPPLEQALRAIHFPRSFEECRNARRRFVLEELLVFSLAMTAIRGRNARVSVPPLPKTDLAPFWASLPFTPTGGQKTAADEILADLESGALMNRLVQGDVGSGKTLVAAAVSYAAIQKGYQAALMAPTEILAAQHEKTLRKFLEPMGVKVGLLTGSLTPKQKTAMREAIERGEIQMVAGTHALVQEATAFHRLGLVITDEQHRFGVHQRQMLGEKGDHPHVLVMSATPIPRTLALIVYGDLDISVIDELPAGRQPIETFSVHSDKRERALTYIRAHLDRGEQGYIVCPLIDKSDAVSAAAATAYRDELAEGIFKGYTVGLLHGRMKPDEKEAVMADFAAGKVQLLVATTVVEVGVDVPNATIILIENAERFGLSQLHQLRGRVGRGDKKSTCILLSDNDGEDNKRRLKVMKETCDGFVIAKEDLKLRGAGDFFGYRQHGMPSLGLADLLEDTALFAKAQAAAAEILQADPGLQKPEHAVLKRQIDEMAAESGKN